MGCRSDPDKLTLQKKIPSPSISRLLIRRLSRAGVWRVETGQVITIDTLSVSGRILGDQLLLARLLLARRGRARVRNFRTSGEGPAVIAAVSWRARWEERCMKSRIVSNCSSS